jgi:hypothetical protein
LQLIFNVGLDTVNLQMFIFSLLLCRKNVYTVSCKPHLYRFNSIILKTFSVVIRSEQHHKPHDIHLVHTQHISADKYGHDQAIIRQYSRQGEAL